MANPIFKKLEQLVCGERRPRPLPDPEDIKALDAEAARQIVLTQEGDLAFLMLTTLAEQAADVLARYDSDLWLGGLTDISTGVAVALARHRHNLCLDGVADISPQTARAIAQHGRAVFNSSLAKARARHERWLKAMRSLYGGKGPPRPAALREAVAFGAMERHDWMMLSLSGLRTLSLEVARELSRHRGVLVLGGLDSISDECAAEIAKHAGSLVLSGLRSLSQPVAATLAGSSRWKPDWILACCELHLDGLRHLDPHVATALAAFDGALSLCGLVELSPPVAAALAAHAPTNVIRKTLDLGGIEHLSAASADALADHAGDLLLNGITEITPELAEPLSRHRGRVFLGSVRQVSGATAEILLASPQVYLVAGPERL